MKYLTFDFMVYHRISHKFARYFGECCIYYLEGSWNATLHRTGMVLFIQNKIVHLSYLIIGAALCYGMYYLRCQKEISNTKYELTCSNMTFLSNQTLTYML